MYQVIDPTAECELLSF
jgi:hypothetical protein